MPRMPNIYLEAQYQQRLWSPAALRPGTWFDAADLSTISVATGVSEWRDKSGNGRHATQSTASKQPAFVPELQNGLGAVRLDGSNDQLDYDGTFISGGAYTMILAHMRQKAGRNYLFGGSTATPGSGTNFLIGGYHIDTTFRVSQFATFNVDVTVPAYSAPDPARIAAFRSNPSAPDQTLRLNGTQGGSGASSAAIGTNGGASLGRYGSPDEFGQADIFEFLLIARSISLPETQAVEGYLSWKWAIPLAADHPFFSRPPLIGD